jgi:hypothetical protein
VKNLQEENSKTLKIKFEPMGKYHLYLDKMIQHYKDADFLKLTFKVMQGQQRYLQLDFSLQGVQKVDTKIHMEKQCMYVQENIEKKQEVNSIMVYCKNFLKCHNVPPMQP